MATALGPRKTIEETLESTEEEGFTLKKDLSALDITVLGVGVMIGAGIFVLTGVAAATDAGPAITLSFVVAAFVCAMAALCYTELSAMVPVAGSAYTFSYATIGQFIAFIIGWDLVLEFTVGAAAVSVGWSAYLNSTLDQIFGFTLPAAISSGPFEDDPGVINLPAVFIALALTVLLVRGIRITAKANIGFVVATIAVLALVIGVGATKVDTANWTPYFPFGFDGVVSGAAIVFFAFIGFDIVATAAEEARKPQRDMPRGILGSLGIVTLLYVAVAAVITGMVAYTQLNTAAPVADAFEAFDLPIVSSIIFVGALVALTNTILVLLLGQTRVAFAMARDQLLPKKLAATHGERGTPYRITLITGIAVAVIAGLTPISDLAELVNIGTLFAFMLVSIGVVLLRRRDPDRPRPFRTPALPVVAFLSIVGCAYLIFKLEESATYLRFLIWMLLGVVVYFAYSRRASLVGQRRADGDEG